MKLFNCQVCSQTLYFENRHCEQCANRIGYVAEDQRLYAVVRTGAPDSLDWQIKGDTARTFRFCANAEHDVCNWLVPADGPAFCLACRHNHTIPDLGKPENRMRWQLIEIAKHRLFYTLLDLGLPLTTRAEDPQEGLVFEFLEDQDPSRKVMTGHDNGRITLAIAEADDAERERRRQSMHEPYRTLLGHFRHEIGHYYWDRLIHDRPDVLDACRRVFGDDREDYAAALQKHYRDGAPADWRDRFVSQYATTHPWEDFAETWAHYLHIVDTLETASAFGVATHPQGIPQADALATEITFEPRKAETITRLMEAWLPLTFALNSLNRSMGLGDLYPFVLTPAIIDKLGFIHDLVHGKVGRAEQPQLDPAPVPRNAPPPPSPAFAGVD